MSAPTLPETGAKSHRQILEALSGLLLVLFLAMISSTVVSVSLPQIIGSLNGTQSQYTWVVTAALLTTTASTPIWGKLADLFSKKLLLEIAIGIFLVASLACGFAQNTAMLIAFRAVQGLGMGALQILVQVIIAAMISPKERGKYNGYLGAVMAVATVGGPLLGGLITDTSWLGWRWCFFLPIPFTAIALIVLHRTLDIVSVRRPGTSVDYPGALLIAAGVSVLLVWVTFVGNSFDWISWQTFAMVGASVVLLGVAVWVESVVREPVVPLHVVRRRTPALAILASLAVGMAMFGGAVFLGQYFQIGRGYSPTEAGLLTIPLMFGVLVSSTISGRMVSRSGRVKPYILASTDRARARFRGPVDGRPRDLAGRRRRGDAGGRRRRRHVHAEPRPGRAEHRAAARAGRRERRDHVLPLAGRHDRRLGPRRGAGEPGHREHHHGPGQGRLSRCRMGQSSGGASLNMGALPEPIRTIVRAAYGDATGHIFLISACIAVVGILAVLFLPQVRLRDSVDLAEPAAPGADAPAAAESR